MKKGKASTILLIIAFVIGLGLLLYPTVANLYNSRFQTKAINNYVEKVSSMNKDDFDAIWQEVEEFNRGLLENRNPCELTAAQAAQYEKLLDVSGTGIMGYIDIPKIEVTLPIYHGASEGVLQIAVGHLEWSSLPAIGESVHCVLSGHRGLPSSKLFTDLPDLVEGDMFSLTVLDKVLSYQIDQILIVKPEETQELMITQNKQYCSLVTCTPYGINTHRILVRGHLISDKDKMSALHITADAVQIEAPIVAPILAIPLLLILIAVLVIPNRRKKKKQKER